MKKIVCRICLVEWDTPVTDENKNAKKIESNWCLNCKYLAKEEYKIFYTLKPVRLKLKSIDKKLF